MGLRLKTAPTTEPVSLTEAKLYLRVDHSEEDDLITSLIVAARQMVEEHTLRALITQTWTMFLDRFPGSYHEQFWDGVVQAHINSLSEGERKVDIPRPPLISVTHVKTYDDDDSASTFDSSNYTVDTTSQHGRLNLKFGKVWPVDLRSSNAIEVEFVCGYGSASAVPASLKTAMLMILSKMYDCRGGDIEVPSIAAKLMAPYRVIYLGGPNDRSQR